MSEGTADQREGLIRMRALAAINQSDRTRPGQQHIVHRKPAPFKTINAAREHMPYYFPARNSRRKILPTLLFGSSSRNSMYLGILYPVRFSLQ